MLVYFDTVVVFFFCTLAVVPSGCSCTHTPSPMEEYTADSVPESRLASFWKFWELVKETANPDTMHTEDLSDEQREKLASYESFDYHKAYPDMYMAYLRGHDGSSTNDHTGGGGGGGGSTATSTYPMMMSMDFHSSPEKREKKTTIIRWLLHVLTAVMVSLVAAVVAYSVDNLESYRAETLSRIVLAVRVPVIGRVLGYFFWLFTALALVAVGTAVVVFIEPAAGGGGIPDVMAYLNGVHMRRAMNVKTFVVKVISCVCAVGSGLPVGLEAPLIHLGAITGAGVTQGRSRTLGIQTNLFQPFRNHRDRRAFITVGAACGVSAAFGAPIGGLLFVMEEISSFWDHSASGQIFLASMIAVTATTMINSLVEEGKLLGWVSHSASVLFEVNISIPFNLKSIIPALVLGAFLGAFAALFTKLNIILIKWRKVHIRPLLYARLLEPMLVVAVYATATYFFSWASDCRSVKVIADVNETIHQWGTEPHSRLFSDTCSDATSTYSPFGTLNMATGKNAIRHLFTRQTAGQFPVYYLFLYFLLYTGFACISSGMAISGGLVVPSLVIGATFGRLYGLILWYIFSANVSVERGYRAEDAWLDPGLFALIGAASFLAGTSRLGMSVCVIVVELSSELRYLLPIMVAIVCSKSMANWLCEPLYHHMLHLDCVPFLSNHIPSPEFEQLTAADVMVPRVTTLRLVEDTPNVWSALESTHHAFPVVEEVSDDDNTNDDEAIRVQKTSIDDGDDNRVGGLDNSNSWENVTVEGSLSESATRRLRLPSMRLEPRKKKRFVGLVTKEDLYVYLSLPQLHSNAVTTSLSPRGTADRGDNSGGIGATTTNSNSAGDCHENAIPIPLGGDDRTSVGSIGDMRYGEWIRHKYNTFFGLSSTSILRGSTTSNFPVGSPDTPSPTVDFQHSANTLSQLPDRVDLSIIVNRSPWVIPPFFNLQMAYETFSMMGLRHMVVVDGEEVCGMITRKDLLPNSLRRRLKELHRRIDESGVAVSALSSRTSRRRGQSGGSRNVSAPASALNLSRRGSPGSGGVASTFLSSAAVKFRGTEETSSPSSPPRTDDHHDVSTNAHCGSHHHTRMSAGSRPPVERRNMNSTESPDERTTEAHSAFSRVHTDPLENPPLSSVVADNSEKRATEGNPTQTSAPVNSSLEDHNVRVAPLSPEELDEILGFTGRSNPMKADQ